MEKGAGIIQNKCRVTMRKRRKGWKLWRPYLYIIPSIVLLAIFYIYPIFNNFYLSFFKWDLINPKEFVGWDNFNALFNNKTFGKILGNTLLYMFCSVGFTVVISVILAVWLNQPTHMRSFAQGVIFTPHIISMVSVSFIWMWMFNEKYGLLNYLLSLIGIEAQKWLSSKELAMPSIILVAVWKQVGYDTLMLIGGLQAIPAQLYEAASLESRNPFQIFRRITLPLLSPTLFFVVIMNLINAAKAFDTVSIMTQGGPVNATNTLVYYIYQRAFNYMQIGRAAAGGSVLFVILMVLTIVYFILLNRRVHYAN